MKLPVLGAAPRLDDSPAPGGLDCVLVGPHISELQEMIDRARPTKGISAHYDDVLVNSVLVGGRRLGHGELLNLALERATGRPHALNPFRQPSGAISYLASFLRRRGFTIDFVNFFSQERDRLRALLAQRPRAVVLTTTFYVETEPLAEVVRFVREHAPDAKIVLGGPYVYRVCSNHDEVTQDYLFQDIAADCFLFDAQGESSLATLLQALRRGGGDDVLARVPNLIWTRDNHTFQRSERVIEKNDLDQNAVDWSLFDPEFIKPTVFMRTALSCPFACTFCGYPIAAGEHVLNDLDVIMGQLRWLAAHGVKNVVFTDDTFNVPLPRFKKLLQRMIDEQLGLKWMSFFRCSNADAGTFELMGRSGCVLSFLGIESADEELLRSMDKHARPERFRDGIKRLHDAGVLTHVSLIIGFPGETQRSIDATKEFLEATRPTFFAPQIFYVEARTPVFQNAEEYGLKGTGFAWQHRTAHWSDAVRWTQEMVKEVRAPEYVGGYSLGAWGTFYLFTVGLSVPQVRGFFSQAREMVIEGLDGREATGLDRLVALFSDDAGARRAV